MLLINRLTILLFVFVCFIILRSTDCRGGGRGGRSGRGRGGARRSYRLSSHNYRSQRTTPKSHSGLPRSNGSHSNPEGFGHFGNNFMARMHNGYVPYTYHDAPQAVYVKQYRNINSRYSNILTGLTLYNLGRSHSLHRHHYYEDDFYRERYNSLAGGNCSLYAAPVEKAKCSLRITQKAVEQRLSVPCEIVSTFADDSEELHVSTNVVVCQNVTFMKNFTTPTNSTILNITLTASPNIDLGNDTKQLSMQKSSTFDNTTSSTTKRMLPAGEISDNVTTQSDEFDSTAEYTVCMSTIFSNSTDPLTQKGPGIIMTARTKCAVEIQTASSLKRNKVACKILEKYFKMPEPEKDSYLTPSRDRLKSWMESPPWWMSLLIAL
ncbi:hypothetical protein EVAR_7801_1 [Eumeta japonica]|uniref:Uncharacterized protein n=1 Tax=Eumeta variegata TaxID=151549 RepID=A0A4C1TJ44_EUMVA|nr:hypothetical protein EVAR_7801_1 [Eumeta japonica]